MSPPSKAPAQRLLHLRDFLGQFPYAIVHILHEEKCWGDSLPRWQRVGANADSEESRVVRARARAVAMYACADAAYFLPSKNALEKRRSLRQSWLGARRRSRPRLERLNWTVKGCTV